MVQARQPLPVDLGQWVVDRLAEQIYSENLRRERDAHLREAALIIGGPLSERVRGILQEASALQRCWPRYAEIEPELGTARGAVHRALLLLPVPGRRRLYTILQPAKSVQSMR